MLETEDDTSREVQEERVPFQDLWSIYGERKEWDLEMTFMLI